MNKYLFIDNLLEPQIYCIFAYKSAHFFCLACLLYKSHNILLTSLKRSLMGCLTPLIFSVAGPNHQNCSTPPQQYINTS